MSERYIQPPPPYELSIQRDQKVTEEEALKASPFREEDWNDSKVVSDKALAVHTLTGIPKYAAPRARRPLPPRPVQGQGNRFRSSADINPYATQNYHATEYSVAPPRSDEPSCMHHPSSSVEHTPLYYPPQSSHDTPRRESGDRWSASVGSSVESLRRPSNMLPQPPSYPLPQNDHFGTRLSFDPSVAYSASQANVRTTFSVRRGATPSLYSSSVSSHLSPLHSYVPALLNTETTKTSAPSLRSLPASTISYTSRRMGRGYEQRWAASESDITNEIYHD